MKKVIKNPYVFSESSSESEDLKFTSRKVGRKVLYKDLAKADSISKHVLKKYPKELKKLQRKMKQ